MDKTLGIYIHQGGVETFIAQTPDSLKHIPVDKSIVKPVNIIEEAIYATPSILGEYSQSEIICESDHFVIVPHRISEDSELIENIAKTFWPEASDGQITTNEVFGDNVVVSCLDGQFSGFVTRTFHKPCIINRIATLVNFFSSLSGPVNRFKLYANISEDLTLDLIMLSVDKLILANTYRCTELVDAFYFIMAAVKDSGFDALDDELIVYGHESHCNSLTEMLRKYINSVMPLLLSTKQREIPLELQHLS